MTPPLLFFPLIAKLVYQNKTSVVQDPECICSETTKCVLCVDTEDQWDVFVKKIQLVLSASPKTPRGGIPYVLVISKENPRVSLCKVEKNRFGEQTWTSHFEF